MATSRSLRSSSAASARASPQCRTSTTEACFCLPWEGIRRIPPQSVVTDGKSNREEQLFKSKLHWSFEISAPGLQVNATGNSADRDRHGQSDQLTISLDLLWSKKQLHSVLRSLHVRTMNENHSAVTTWPRNTRLTWLPYAYMSSLWCPLGEFRPTVPSSQKTASGSEATKHPGHQRREGSLHRAPP